MLHLKLRYGAIPLIVTALTACNITVPCGQNCPETNPDDSTVPETPNDSESPLYSEDFAESPFINWYQRISNDTGTIKLALTDAGANDRKIAQLVFPGNPDLTSQDQTSPSKATELWFSPSGQKTHYGRYEVRVKFAQCNDDEEVVNGLFVYHNDGASDDNQNNILDNSEIDIELLCGQPSKLWLSTWTDYDFRTEKFMKKSRMIDMRTGDYYQTPSGGEHLYDTVYKGTLTDVSSEMSFLNFPEPNTFYTLGFDWHSTFIEWFIKTDTKEITLWKMEDTNMIPTHPADFFFNLWHAPTHWSFTGEADYPENDAVMSIDYFRYYPSEN